MFIEVTSSPQAVLAFWVRQHSLEREAVNKDFQTWCGVVEKVKVSASRDLLNDLYLHPCFMLCAYIL